MGRELARVQRSGETLVLSFIDVDGLEGVNDTQGHLAATRSCKAPPRPCATTCAPMTPCCATAAMSPSARWSGWMSPGPEPVSRR